MRRLWALLAVLLLTGCATTGGYSRLPDPVTEWLEANTWRVETPSTGGTGFWFDDRFLTACHIVNKFPVAYIHNIDRTQMTLAKVSSCDPGADIAVLTPIDSPNNKMDEFATRTIKLADETPRPGTLIYSAGWQMGGPFGYTTGVLNSKSDNGYETDMHMVYGDSGSPVLAMRAGRAELVGILLAINSIQTTTEDDDIQEIVVFGSSVIHGARTIGAALDAYQAREG